MDNLDFKTFSKYMDDYFQAKKNQLDYSTRYVPKRVEKVTLSLATAPTAGNYYKIAVPFKSVLVSRIYSTSSPTTDKAGSIKIFFDQDNIANVQNATTLFVNDTFVLDTEVAVGYLTWDAQSDTSVDIYFFVDIDYRAGTTKTQIVGNVTVVQGSQTSAVAVKAVPDLVTRLKVANTTTAYSVRAGYYADVFWSITGSTTNTATISIGGTDIVGMNGAGGANFALSGRSSATAGQSVSATTNAAGSIAYVQIVEYPI